MSKLRWGRLFNPSTRVRPGVASSPPGYLVAILPPSGTSPPQSSTTSRVSEGENNSLASAFASKHPTIWDFITKLKRFHAEVEKKYGLIDQGIRPDEPQRRRWREREQRIKDFVDNYNPSAKLIFIRRIGLHFN